VVLEIPVLFLQFLELNYTPDLLEGYLGFLWVVVCMIFLFLGVFGLILYFV